MASFTVSVELRNATESARGQLRIDMAAHGFRHNASCDAGVSYELPRDEYICLSLSNRDEIISKVFKLASACSPDPAIIVTESVGRAGQGLHETKQF